MSILNLILDLIIIVVITVGVAGLVVSLGKWKIKMGLLPRFKSFTMPRHHERRGISEHVTFLLCRVLDSRTRRICYRTALHQQTKL